MTRHPRSAPQFFSLLCALAAASCATTAAPRPPAAAPARSKPRVTQRPRPKRLVCVIRGRLQSFNGAYRGRGDKASLVSLSGTQVIGRVSPPRRFGGRVRAVLRWPLLGPLWLASARVFALARPLPIPELGLTILARRYLAHTRQLPDGRVMVRVDLGKRSLPRHVERTVPCAQMALGRFNPIKPYRRDGPPKRYAIFKRGRGAAGVPLSLAPGGPQVLNLDLHSARVVADKGDWLQILGERGPVAFAGWVPKSAVAKRSGTGGLGVLSILGKRGGKGKAPPWRVTTRPVDLRLAPGPHAPVVARLAPRVLVRRHEAHGDYVRITIGPVRRANTPRVDDPKNRGFFVRASALATRPRRKRPAP